MIAEVLVPRPLYQSWSYLVPDPLVSLVCPGHRVVVPFGSQTEVGIVISLQESCEKEKTSLKSLISLVEGFSFFKGSSLELLSWLSLESVSPPGEVAHLFVPSYCPPVSNSYCLAGEITQILAKISHRKKKLREALIRLSLKNQSVFTKEELLDVFSSPALFRESVQNNYLSLVTDFKKLQDHQFSYSKKKTSLC